ncbi:hypothetical protein D9613_012482 [Agrocybe pediades]|uniref:KOW domain-containing protein n=1 Tax=Agrocybe pediades TaxID=84607 RepID=A0A8H4QSY0_9AGAR|nr:hypothetical protein D9613_012482 [Agrocybe pediades]
MTEHRITKRRRIDQNPFIDIEASVGNDNEEEEDGELDSDFIVDGAIDIDEDDLLSADGTASPGPSRFTPPVDHTINEQYSALLERALARGAKKQSPQGIIHEGVADALLGPKPSSDRQTWVRIRLMKGSLSVFVGDLALAIRTKHPNLFEYWIVPRTALFKENKATRPVQALFDSSLAIVSEGEHSVEPTGGENTHCSYHFQGACYSKRGFFLISGPPTIAISFSSQVLPTPKEFEIFSRCEALDPTFLLKTKSLMGQNSIARGDRVKCIAGELRNLIGVVLECEEDSLKVHFDSLDIDYSVMRYEVHKYFRIGDRVIIQDTGFGERKGWVISCEENSACVFDPTTQEEMQHSWHKLRFDDTIDSYRLRNLSRSPSFQLQERHAMRQNLNRVFEKKDVMVTGSHYKGIRGVVMDTTIDGYAFVSLALFNHPRKEKIKLSDLQIIVSGKDNDYLVPIVPQPDSDSFISMLPHPPPLVSASLDSISSSQMPLPSVHSGSLSSAWNPAASTPLWSLSPGIEHSSTVTRAVSFTSALDIPTWLGDPKLDGTRVKLCLRGDRTRLFKMRTVINDIVTVRDGMKILEYPLADLDFVRPEGCTDAVVSFAPGELFGKIFRVKEFGPVESVVHIFGQRQTRKNTFALRTSTLAVVYPPLR